MTLDFPLLSDRLRLRCFRPDDHDAIHGVYGDPEVMRHVAYGAPASSEESARMVTDYIRHQERHGYSFWVVEDRATGTVIGDAGFEARDDGAEFGYTLARAWWGRGLATEAGRLCVSVAFRDLGLPRLTAVVDPRNPASSRVLEKLGFRFVERRAAYGRPHDEYLLTTGEWARSTEDGTRAAPDEPVPCRVL
ncbi:RimJ/RimL family protein N-acetyltransferase [Murinocardiopsis flavida]|uniref:RimJ/RimL family protein N-acetyltransferase n=1 Tax=Murinocardiopsis flavida TaxID=645275 RepID=A0A2P8CJ81_9ACTN|nr:GNAT family N-acetyltransferase [Murinocardiopsis flavida]PSK85002.1 RimJ/RimL family protein N-acetyltransferase [Murinocardiopsis flavida]